MVVPVLLYLAVFFLLLHLLDRLATQPPPAPPPSGRSVRILP
ncbi:MAG TPA: hypothetical protein VFY93_12060 [Planctomycetota bacterium]|nr:hypothetical protein [Planctomycetota bacterium]